MPRNTDAAAEPVAGLLILAKRFGCVEVRPVLDSGGEPRGLYRIMPVGADSVQGTLRDLVKYLQGVLAEEVETIRDDIVGRLLAGGCLDATAVDAAATRLVELTRRRQDPPPSS